MPSSRTLPEGGDRDLPLRERVRELEAQLADARARARTAEAEREAVDAILTAVPDAFLVLSPPDFEIVAASGAYLQATGRARDEVVGKTVFQAFPADPEDPTTEDGLSALGRSLAAVVATGGADAMAVQRYPIPRAPEAGGGFEERYWSVVNSPVPGADGAVRFIVHRAEDVTTYIRSRVGPLPAGEELRVLSGRERLEADLVLRAQEIQRLNRELAASESRLRQVFEGAAAGIAVALPDGRYDYVNPAYARILGYSPEEMKAHRFQDITHAEDRSENERLYQELLEGTRQNFVLEKRNLRKDGTPVWVRVSASLLRDSDGTPLRSVAITEDVTTERTARDRLEEMEARFRAAARATSDLIWEWDVVGGGIWWAEGLDSGKREGDTPTLDPALLGPTVAEWTDRIHPADRPRIEASVAAALEGTSPEWSDQYRLLMEGDRPVWVQARGEIIRDPQGRPLRMVGGITDESSELAAMERLREQAELLDRAHDAILVRTPEHAVVYMNRSAEALYGWTRDELEGRSARELFHPDPARFDRAMEHLLAHDEWAGETVHKRKDGSVFPVDSRWSLVRDASGAAHRIMSVNTDLTERRHLHAQVLRSQRLESIGTLAGGIAHDLNNVLAPVLMSIGLLQDEITDPELREVLETIEQSAERGAGLVRQVLGFARGVEGDPVPLELASVVAELARVVRDTFPRNITFHTRIPDDLPLLRADITQLHQVLLNLLVNARDAMPEGGTLSVEAAAVELDAMQAAGMPQARPGPHIRVAIRDTGTGIPPQLLDQIFDPFFTTKEVGQGTGLGLSTVAAIMRGHGGFVTVYTEVGRGTTFGLHFPLDAGGSPDPGVLAPALPHVADDGPRRGSGELLLVVDDERSVRDITRQTLEAFGYRVLTAADGTEAVALYGRHGSEVDLVLTDIMMPIMDGPATVRALRRMDPEVRIVAASGLGTQEEVSGLLALGIMNFLPKPYTADTLLRVVREALDRTGVSG